MQNNNNILLPGLRFAAMLLLSVRMYFCPYVAQAQGRQAAAADPGLQHIFRNVKQADGYAYQVCIENAFPGDTQRGTPQYMSGYTSHTSFVYYVSMSNEVFFVSNKGSFSVDSAAKRVNYQAFANDREREEQKQYYATTLRGMLDSIFLDKGYILRKNATKKTVRYQVAYPPQHSLISLDVTARSTDYFPEKICYVMDRALSPVAPAATVRQKLTIDGYTNKVPAAVQSLLSGTEPLDRQLAMLYPGYTLEKAN